MGAVGKPVSTVVGTPSTAAVLAGPAADQARVPTSEDTAGSETTVASEGTDGSEVADGSEDAGDSGDAAVSQDAGDSDVRGNPGKCVNLSTHGEPLGGGRRPTGVTATLPGSAILPEMAPAIAPGGEALVPDASATSEFDAEGRRKPAVWAAADVVTEIYHGHYHSLVRLAVLLVHDVQTAEEVVQDAFEAMHLASRRLRDSERALQYLRQTVVNKSRSVLRHRKVVDMHAPKPAPDEPSAEHAALAILERSAVAAALRSLPERQREAIALRYYADFSEADIARAMGISKGAVKSHTARAMASLKAMLSQETS